MNTEPVYQNQYLNSPAGNNFPKGFVGYVTEQFKEAVKNTADSQTVLMVANIVVDKQGKVVYCERYYQKRLADHQINYPKWQPYPTREPALDKIVDRIVAGSPQWLPGRVDGKPVNTQVIYTGGDGSGGC